MLGYKMEHVQLLHGQIDLQELVRAFHKVPFKYQDNLVSQHWHPESPVSVWMTWWMPQWVERKIGAHHAVMTVRTETVSLLSLDGIWVPATGQHYDPE